MQQLPVEVEVAGGKVEVWREISRDWRPVVRWRKAVDSKAKRG